MKRKTLKLCRVSPLEKISVLLVDDNAVVRKGLRTLLETEDYVAVIGQARNGREAVKMAQMLRVASVSVRTDKNLSHRGGGGGGDGEID